MNTELVLRKSFVKTFYFLNSVVAMSARVLLYSKVKTFPFGYTALAKHNVIHPDPVPDSITLHPGYKSNPATIMLESISLTTCVLV